MDRLRRSRQDGRLESGIDDRKLHTQSLKSIQGTSPWIASLFAIQQRLASNASFERRIGQDIVRGHGHGHQSS
jgi:hypothetical protein